MKKCLFIILGYAMLLTSNTDGNLAHAEADNFLIDIPTYLDKVRNQFEESARKHQVDKSMPLYIEKVHVEMTVVARKEAEGEVKVYVLDFTGKADKSTTQKLSFDIYLTKPEKPVFETHQTVPSENKPQVFRIVTAEGEKDVIRSEDISVIRAEDIDLGKGPRYKRAFYLQSENELNKLVDYPQFLEEYNISGFLVEARKPIAKEDMEVDPNVKTTFPRK